MQISEKKYLQSVFGKKYHPKTREGTPYFVKYFWPLFVEDKHLWPANLPLYAMYE